MYSVNLYLCDIQKKHLQGHAHSYCGHLVRDPAHSITHLPGQRNPPRRLRAAERRANMASVTQLRLLLHEENLLQRGSEFIIQTQDVSARFLVEEEEAFLHVQFIFG